MPRVFVCNIEPRKLETSWSIDDKKKLLMALQKCGNNIAEIQKLLPHKTISEIRYAFELYSTLAYNKMNQQEKLRKEDSAINQWIDLVNKTRVKNNEVYDIIPRVLKYIALFEERPQDNDVNLSDCYMAISELSNGMVSKNLNPTTNDFFFENLSRLALQIRKDDTSKQRNFIKNIKSFDHIFKAQPVIKTYNRKKKKANVIINPLNIPDELLIMNQKVQKTDNLV